VTKGVGYIHPIVVLIAVVYFHAISPGFGGFGLEGKRIDPWLENNDKSFYLAF